MAGKWPRFGGPRPSGQLGMSWVDWLCTSADKRMLSGRRAVVMVQRAAVGCGCSALIRFLSHIGTLFVLVPRWNPNFVGPKWTRHDHRNKSWDLSKRMQDMMYIAEYLDVRSSIYLHMYTCMYAYMFKYVYMYISTCIYISMLYIHIYTCRDSSSWKASSSLRCSDTGTHVFSCAYVCVCVCVYMCMY